MDKTDSKPVSDKELEEESEIEEVIEKDGAGYGDLQSLNAQPDDTNRDAETYVGRPAPKESETYIQERKSYTMGMTDQNKLKNTKLGDHINYYDNGVAGNGVVSKMSGQFIQIFKDDGKFYNININDTFHVSDILINKTWDEMNLADRTEQLMKIKAYSPRFLSKTWDQLPRELKDVMKKDGALPKNPKDYTEDEETLVGLTSELENANQAQAHINDPKNWANLQDRLSSHDYTHTGKEKPSKEYKVGGQRFRDNDDTSRTPTSLRRRLQKSNISKAEWDLMKDTDHDELTAARASKRETQDYSKPDEEIFMGGDDPVDTGYQPKGKRKKVKITKAEWDSMKASPQHATGEPDKQHASHNSESTPQLGGVEDDYEHGEPYKNPKQNNYDPEHNDLEYTKHSSIEDGALGNTGSSPTTGVSTKIPFDATEDYEGTTHDTRPTQFEYEDKKPEVGNEPKAPEVKLDEQGLIKANPSFVYSDNPQGYKLPPQPKQKGYGMRYGVKYINEEEDN
jgi:hypothetical protein